MSVESPFEIFLQERLNFKKYNELDLLLGVSPHRVTKLLSDPGIMTVEEINKLSKICDMDAKTLILDYKCGFENITVQEAVTLGLTINTNAA